MSRISYRGLALIGCLSWVLSIGTSTVVHAASGDRFNVQQVRKALGQANPQRRVKGLQKLSELGTAKDAALVYPLLGDADPTVRQIALATVWQLWGKSGDPMIDRRYQEGLALMKAGDLPQALEIFSDIILKQPEFVEAWNKRATLHYLTGDYDLSMQDCEEVLKRLAQHFGALVGYAQMLAERGEPERALALMERANKVNPYLPNAELMMSALRVQVEANRRKLL